MTRFPRTALIARRVAYSAAAGGPAGVVLAAPAGAHHDPDQLAATEAGALALDVESSSGGLPISLVMASSLALLIVMAMVRGVRVTGRGRRLVVLVSVGSLLALPLASSPAGAATVLLPDLISDQPDPVGSPEINTYTGTPRLVLRFDGYVTNVGDGPLEVSGNPQITNSGNANAVHQRALDTNGDWSTVGTPLVQYETADGHNHFHLMEVGRYSLWNESQTAEAAPGQKVGFCLYDIERAEAEDYSGPQNSRAYSGNVTQFCDSNNPSTTDLVMGTSAGWRDVYGAYLTFQWVDVSETAPGIYYLANEADPHNRIVESDETNNQVGFAEQSSTIPGYNALPVGPVSTLGSPIDVTLTSEQFGSPGSRRFEIVTTPAHGTLDVSVGTSFSSPTVTYTPASGYSGPDSFEYLARDNSSAYPLNPTQAAVSIDVGEAPVASVQISGAPVSLIAGTSAALTATVSNALGGVTWSVDGTNGGNATVGTVDSSGLYIAPSAVPTGGEATVRATLDADASVFDEVTIVIDPIPNNAPVVSQPADQASVVDDEISFLIEANDPDGDAFTFDAEGLPVGLAIHPNTGLITGTASAAGSHAVTVTVDDGTDPTVVSFDWTVDLRPEITPSGAGIVEGDSGSQTVSVPVVLSAPVSQPVTIDWTTIGGTQPGIASEGSDFISASGQVVFAPGETTATAEITIIGDQETEVPLLWGEWGFVAFSAPSANATLNTSFYGLGIFVIVDDD